MSGEWQFTDFYDITFDPHKEQLKLKQFTDITVLLDRSGSMESIKEPMQTAFNKFIEEHKAVPTTKISLVQFDSLDDQEIVYQGVPITHAEKLVLKPRGSTPLVDSFVKLIDRTGRRFAEMNESDRPDQVLFVVITDGEENASTKYKRQDVFNRVTKQHNDYKWQFVYLGANQDAIAEAASYGIARDFALSYNATKGGVRGSSSAYSVNTVAFAQASGSARGSSMGSFTNTQRKEAVEEAVPDTTWTTPVVPNQQNSNS